MSEPLHRGGWDLPVAQGLAEPVLLAGMPRDYAVVMGTVALVPTRWRAGLCLPLRLAVQGQGRRVRRGPRHGHEPGVPQHPPADAGRRHRLGARDGRCDGRRIARTGVPAANGLPPWRPYGADGRETMVVNSPWRRMTPDPNRDGRLFWAEAGGGAA